MPVTESFRRLVGPLAEYLDPNAGVEEININGYGGFFLVRSGGCKDYVSHAWIDAHWCDGIIAAIEGYVCGEISRHNPILSAKLFSGERVEIVVPPCVAEPVISIRIPSDRVFTLDDFAFVNDVNRRELIRLVERRQTLLISGSTRSGKTALMSSLIEFVPYDDRILTLEDVPELNIPIELHPDQVRLYFNRSNDNQSARALFKSGMRLDPDMISLAECRGGEALDFLSAANSGHYGMTTVHADNPEMALSKMAVLAAQSETAMSHENLLEYLRSIIDGVVQISLDRNTQQRVVSEVYTP